MRKIIVFIATVLFALNTPNLDYRMDECKWDNNSNTFEILNSGSAGSDYNASAVSAYVLKGKINNGGYFNGSYMQLKNYFPLGNSWSATFWVKFPLNGTESQDYIYEWNRGWDRYYLYVIGSVDGTGDIGLFLKDSYGDYQFGVYDNNGYLEYINIPDLIDGWHFFALVNNGVSTTLYIDGNSTPYTVDLSTKGNLALIGSSTDYSNDKTIGAEMDEFKIWNNYELSTSEIYNIYNNENSGLNYDGSSRNIIECPINQLIDLKMDECSWDNDTATYEIKNSGVMGNEYNATSVNEANVTIGKICNGGDINSTSTEDKAVLLENNFILPADYTLNLWIKFPLSFEGHYNFGSNTNNTYFFNIADRPGSSYDYIYFDYSNSTWYLCVMDDNNKDCQEFDPNSYSGWHMLTFNVSSSNQETDFYVDAQKKLTFSAYPTGKLGLLFNSDYGSFIDNQPNEQSIGSDVDEFEIYSQILDDSQIQEIYNYENSGKNYDGSLRVCPICNYTNNKDSTFNAVDYISDVAQCNAVNDWDDNITTKFADKEFNLTLLAKDPDTDTPLEANITKVTLYYYDSSSNGQCSGNLIGSKVICNNCGQTNANGCMTLDENTLNVDRAVKCVEVNIQGRALSNTSTDVNESNSTDNFAVRPYKFIITNIPNTVKAGNDFNITIKAVDENGNPVKDYNETVYVNGQSVDLEYNETKSGCKTGILNKVSGGNFVNGEANITLNYNEVGDLNLTVKEVNGSEYALVDSDDTNDNQRFIQSVSDVLDFSVDHFKLSALFENYDKDGNFTYYDRDLNIASKLELNITAVDKNGNVLSNYNKDCYAKNITVDIAHNNVDVNVSKILYKYIDTNGTEYDGNVSKDENVTFVYNKNNFTTDNNGSTSVNVYFNFDRNSSVVLNPFEFNITDIDVNDTDANGTLNLNETARYYYGNLLLSDVLAVENDFNKTYPFIVYDGNGVLNPGTKEFVYDWYLNDKHSAIDGNVTDSEIVVSKDFNASNTLNGVTVSVVSIDSGKITFKIDRTNSNVNYAVIHLLSPNLKWLWYSKFYEKYDISNNSSCLNHFCFAVSWQNTNNEGEVGSGEFNGTEANVTDTNSTKRGVKIFR